MPAGPVGLRKLAGCLKGLATIGDLKNLPTGVRSTLDGALHAFTANWDEAVQLAAVSVAATVHEADACAIAALTACLSYRRLGAAVRSAAAEGLGRVAKRCDADVIASLTLVDDEDVSIRRAALRALAQIVGDDEFRAFFDTGMERRLSIATNGSGRSPASSMGAAAAEATRLHRSSAPPAFQATASVIEPSSTAAASSAAAVEAPNGHSPQVIAPVAAADESSSIRPPSGIPEDTNLRGSNAPVAATDAAAAASSLPAPGSSATELEPRRSTQQAASHSSLPAPSTSPAEPRRSTQQAASDSSVPAPSTSPAVSSTTVLNEMNPVSSSTELSRSTLDAHVKDMEVNGPMHDASLQKPDKAPTSRATTEPSRPLVSAHVKDVKVNGPMPWPMPAASLHESDKPPSSRATAEPSRPNRSARVKEVEANGPMPEVSLQEADKPPAAPVPSALAARSPGPEAPPNVQDATSPVLDSGMPASAAAPSAVAVEETTSSRSPEAPTGMLTSGGHVDSSVVSSSQRASQNVGPSVETSNGAHARDPADPQLHASQWYTERVKEVYLKHASSMRGSVSEAGVDNSRANNVLLGLLKKYEGQEDALYAKLCGKFHVQPATRYGSETSS